MLAKPGAEEKDVLLLKRALIDSLTQIGADHKQGKAPPGALEREVGAYVKLLQE